MNNYKKNEKYKELMSKMTKAINNEFYYESILLEFSILEDRTESLLRHAGLKTKGLTLNEKLKKIQKSNIFKDKYILKHIDNELIDSILKWKDKRNKIIHNLVKLTYSNEQIKDIALEGYEIVKRLNNKSTLVNKYFEKKNSKVLVCFCQYKNVGNSKNNFVGKPTFLF